MRILSQMTVAISIALLTSSGIAQANLLAFYAFEGNANDTSGNGNHGVLNGPNPTPNGIQGGAYDFDGVNDYISFPININASMHPKLTMGAWVNTDTFAPIQTVLSHDNGAFDRSLVIDFRGSIDPTTWSAFRGVTGTGVHSSGKVPFPGVWYFLAVTYDQTLNNMTLYVNETAISTLTNFNSGFNILWAGGNPGFAEHFDGRMDNVFLFDEVLTSNELDHIRRGGANAILSLPSPEPSSIVLATLALLGLLTHGRRRRA